MAPPPTRPAAFAPEISLTATDSGVPVLWAPYGGALRARLLFRVGHADETFATTGITHLAEHLALSTVGQPTYPFNGAVEETVTSFDVSGDAAEVVHHLRQVCSALHRLPLDRLETEKRILRIEHGDTAHPMWPVRVGRYGVRGYGLTGAPEVGVHGLRGDVLQAWASQVFTAGNAVLWLSGPPPPGLLLPLPSGPRYAAPAPTFRPVPGPTWWRSDGAGLVLHAVGRKSDALAAGAWWLRRLLHHRLRVVGGHSYSPQVELETLAHGFVELFLLADGLAGTGDALTRAVLGVLDEATRHPMPDVELTAWNRGLQQQLDEPTAVLSLLERNARRLLAGEPLQSTEQLRAAAASVSGEAVPKELGQTLASSIMGIPADAVAPGPGWHAQRPWGDDAVATGEVFVTAAHLPAGGRLRIGPEGVRAEDATGDSWGVRWENCAAMLRYPDGERRLMHVEGMEARVLPGMWADGDRIPLALDLAAPPDRVVDVPMPEGSTPDVATIRLSGLASMSTAFLVVLLVAFTAAGLLLLPLLGEPGSSTAAVLACAGALLLLDVWFARALVRRLRAPKRARSRAAAVRTPADVRIDSALARSSNGTALAVAVGAWTLAVGLFVVFAANGVAFWPAVFLAGFAVRATDNYRRRRVR